MATLDQFNSCLTRFDMDIAAAAQDGSDFAAYDVNTHRSFYGDRFAIDRPNFVAWRRIVVSRTGGCGPKRERADASEQDPKDPAVRKDYVPTQQAVKLLGLQGRCNTPIIYETLDDDGRHAYREDRQQEVVSAHYDVRLPKLPWHRRIQIPVIAAVVYSIIRTLGPTLRFEVIGRRHAEEQWASKSRAYGPSGME